MRQATLNKSVGFSATQAAIDFGDAVGECLESLLSSEHAGRAATTCRFTFQGPKSVGKSGQNWGEWIRTSLYTFGNVLAMDHAWQTGRDGWIRGDSNEAANLILDCFGLSVEDVFAKWGQPSEGEKFALSLQEIVEALNPMLVQSYLARAIA